MSLKAAIPVRFSESTRDRLQAVSDKSGLSFSDLVRRATESYLEKIEREGSVNIEMKESPINYKAKKP